MKDATNPSSFQSHISVANIPRFGVDLQYESLKNYLDTISGTINQHAQLFDSIQKDMTTKIEVNQLSDILINISEGCNIHETDFMRIIQSQFGRNFRSETLGNSLEIAQSKLQNKEQLFSYGISYLFQKLSAYEKRFVEIEENVQNRVNKQLWRDKKKKNKKYHEQQIKDIKEVYDGHLREMDTKLVKEISQMEDKVIDTEKKTLWRINECEESIKNKVNEVFVHDSLVNLEHRLKREFGGLARDAEGFEIQLQDIRQIIKNMDLQLNDKIKINKKLSGDLDANHQKNLLKILALEEKDVQQESKIDGLILEFKELEKKSDYAMIIHRQNGRLKSLEDKLHELENDLLQRMNDMSLRSNGSGSGVSIDPHLLCQLQNDLARIQGEYNKTKNLLRELQTEIQSKLDLVDQTMLQSAEIKEISQIQHEDKGLGQNFEDLKDKLMQFLQPKLDAIYVDIFTIIDDDKIKKMYKDIADLNKRMESVIENDKKLQRLLKELDMNHLIKMISSKAEDQDVQLELLNLDQKINEIKDGLQRAQKDNETQLKNFKVNQSQMNSLVKQQPVSEEQQIIATSKRLFPLNGSCISCAKQPNQSAYIKQSATNNGYALGSDGRPYKVDMQTIFNKVNNGQELFIGIEDINRQQSAPNLKLFQRPSTAKPQQKDVKITKLTRPDSAKDKFY